VVEVVEVCLCPKFSLPNMYPQWMLLPVLQVYLMVEVVEVKVLEILLLLVVC
jgi:hypothetical protein